jgi:predicted cobalt transporter CbtA
MCTWKNSVHHGVVAFVALGLLAACGASPATAGPAHPAAGEPPDRLVSWLAGEPGVELR